MTNKYKSRYSPDKLVTAAQYITELICEKKGRLDGKDLPIFFWRLPEWKQFYKSQIFAAYGLLKLYTPEAIISAIKLPAAKYQYSLRSKKLDALIDAEQARIDKISKEANKESYQSHQEEISKNSILEIPRQPIGNSNNSLKKLRNL